MVEEQVVVGLVRGLVDGWMDGWVDGWRVHTGTGVLCTGSDYIKPEHMTSSLQLPMLHRDAYHQS